jgi:hypothetical protein
VGTAPCTTTSTTTVNVEVSTGAGTIAGNHGISAWTGRDAINVRLDGRFAAVRVRLHDASGKLVRSIDMPMATSEVLSIPTADLAPGIWFLSVETGELSEQFKLNLIR